MSERDLFANFDRMRREMDSLLGGVFGRAGMAQRGLGFSPPIDVAYSTQPPAAVVTIELAGVDPDELQIEIQGRQLIVYGARRPAPAEDCVYQQVEIERGPFRRVITLAADIAADRAAASYEGGMLKIEVPLRVAPARHRTVPIEGGGR